ncbi:MAG TPA: hypothetical protein VKU44_00855 [Terriglobia bacterium]|nr:hypothetical protein [Terriglobia bacterium]
MRLELPTPPPPPAQTQPTPPPPKPQPPPPPPPGPPGPLQKQVADYLDGANFDVMLVDPESTPGPKTLAFFSTIVGVDFVGVPVKTPPQKMTLDDITSIVYSTLKLTVANLNRNDVFNAVLQAYKDKLADHESSKWQFVISMLYTPQYFFWSNQALPSPWQNGYQVTLGETYQSHPFGVAGFEHSILLQLSGSSFSFDQPDWFQNLLAVYQGAYVAPLGREFQFLGMPGVWSYLQGSVFAQVAAGTGSPGEKKLYLGFMAQGAVGGQLALNIGWLQIIVNDQFVYSWLSPTVEPHSRPLVTFGNQLGFGLGGQF